MATSPDSVMGHAIKVEPSQSFVSTPHVQKVNQRALAYLKAGFPIHFAGPAGVGKTSLAFHLAVQLDVPVVLMHGDAEFGSSNLVGKSDGFRHSKVVDNFIHSVVKVEEEAKTMWVDNKLTSACQHGYTLIYDEFNRSRPEANNVLLSVLAEGVLNLPKGHGGRKGYVPVHPGFRIIFTSNPDEYAGVHKAQDALMDRMITIHLDHYDRESEIQIVVAKTGRSRRDAEVITDIVRRMRGDEGKNSRPTIRAAITIGAVMTSMDAQVGWHDERFRWACRDVLGRDVARVTRAGHTVSTQIDQVVQEVCKQYTGPSADAPMPDHLNGAFS
ncbi:MAG: gas vesicle protein GvpN [Proteobacteria bacterium]|nr:gas vesicle protein GvpN [Pseudomonadota bacterium]